jgi:sterol desaturase/sphingolipid hydroxylase (fatty acid hydroxylase superfamily)
VHHSSNELTLSAAYRIGWLQHLTGATVFFAPLVWLGFRPEVVAMALSLNLLYQFWLHTTWIPRLGWLEWILNTPSAHRVHHAANIEYLDANYGGVLIIFDRFFGTYRPERSDLPCRFGLVTPQTSHNVLRVEFDPWIACVHDLRQAHSLREVLGYLFAPPGWRPDGEGETTEALRRRFDVARSLPTA